MTIQRQFNIRKTLIQSASVLGIVLFLHAGVTAHATGQAPKAQEPSKTKEQVQQDPGGMMKGMWLPVITVKPETGNA